MRTWLDVKQKKTYCCDKRDLLLWQKRPIAVPYCFPKRDRLLCEHVFTPSHVPTCMHASTSLRLCFSTCICMCLRACGCVCVSVSVCVCVCACVCVCVRVCMCPQDDWDDTTPLLFTMEPWPCISPHLKAPEYVWPEGHRRKPCPWIHERRIMLEIAL